MKKIILSAGLFLSLSFTALCQEKTKDYDAPEAFSANFEDGSKIDYTLSNRNPDKLAHLCIYFPANISFTLLPGNQQNIYAFDWVGLTYYQPNLFYAEASAGFSPLDWDVSALLFFKKWARVSKQSITLKSQKHMNYTTNYQSPTVDMPVKSYVGVHLGYGGRNFGTINEDVKVPTNYYGSYISLPETYVYNAPQITIGLGYLGVEHYTLFTTVKNKTRTYSHQNSFYLDALLYPSATASNVNINVNDFSPGYTLPSSYYKVTLQPNLFQGRIYYEHKWARTGGNYEWGGMFKLGYATSPLNYLYLFTTLGFYFRVF